MSGVEEPIGQRIRRLRRERRLSLRDLATPGVSYTYLSRVEAGHRNPSIRAIRALAQKLGVTPEYLETGVELEAREEVELTLADLQLAMRLEPNRPDRETEFLRVVERAAALGDDELALKAQTAYGMALSGWGRLDDAAAVLNVALRHPLATPDVYTEAYVTLALAYLNSGREHAAASLCEEALRRTPREDGAARIVLTTHLSYALADIGQFAQAEEVLEELERDISDADPYVRARMHWSLARVEAMQNKRRLALHHMRKAITLLQGTEDTLLVARAHLLCAQILLWGGRVEGVAFHLSSARALLPAHAGPEDHSWANALRALLAAREGRHDEAAALADAALAVDGPGHAAASYAKALALTGASAFDAAEAAFDDSLGRLLKSRLWREAAMVAQDRARARRRAGDDAGAVRWSREAEAYAARVSAHRAVPT